MDKIIELIKENIALIGIVCGVGLVLCAIIYALFYKKINAIIKKNKEIITYIIFGGLTTVVNFAVYTPLVWAFGEKSAFAVNVVAWVVAVAFAYITNKLWVFESKSWKSDVLKKELPSFIGARLLSLGVEEVIIIIFVNWLSCNSLVIKIITQIIVVLMNYVLSKLVIFKKK